MFFRSLLVLATSLLGIQAKSITDCIHTGDLKFSTTCRSSYALNATSVPTSIITRNSTNTQSVFATVTATEFRRILFYPGRHHITSAIDGAAILDLSTVAGVVSLVKTGTQVVQTSTREEPQVTLTHTVSTTEVVTVTKPPPTNFVPVADTIDKIYPEPKNHNIRRLLNEQNREVDAYRAHDEDKINRAPRVYCEVQAYVHKTCIVSLTTTVINSVVMTYAAQNHTSDTVITGSASTSNSNSTAIATATVTSNSTPISTSDPKITSIVVSNSTTTANTSAVTSVPSTISSSPIITVNVTTTISFTSTTTVNGACQSNNVMDHFVFGRRIVAPIEVHNNGFTNSAIYTRVYAIDAYECCDMCSTRAGCTGSMYHEHHCHLLSYADNKMKQCRPWENKAVVFFADSVRSTGVYLSNGPCGYFQREPRCLDEEGSYVYGTECEIHPEARSFA